MNDIIIFTPLTSDDEKYEHYVKTTKLRKMTYVPLIPNSYDFEVSDNASGIKSQKAGVYLLFNKSMQIVNIGATSHLRVRVTQKITGKSSGSIADMNFQNFYFHAKGYYIESWIDRALMEIYLINVRKPKLNYQYAYYDKSIYKTLVKGFLNQNRGIIRSINRNKNRNISRTVDADFINLCDYIAGKEDDQIANYHSR